MRTFNGPRQAAEKAGEIRFLYAPGRLPRGMRVYAVGDIHGQREKLVRLHELIRQDLANRPSQAATLVYLGDYLNQGPDSAGVISELLAARFPPNLRVVNLLGDHERMLLDALDGDRAAATDWLWAGGRDALPSWGLDSDLPREAWAEALPADHIAFLRSLELSFQLGSYLFVHAGLRPGVAPRDQARDDLTMIRQPFLSSEVDHGLVVVHGHSSSPSVPILPNRIGLDTGAGIGGKLTCAVLEDDVLGLLAA